MSEITIEKSILHILDTSIGTPVLSGRVLPPDESTDFFSKHIEKLLGDSELKECRFEEGDSPAGTLFERICDE